MLPTYLDDITVGTSFRTARRTVTEADIVAFAGVSGDFNPLHTDEIFAREEGPFGGRIAHGPLVLSLSYGLASIRDDWQILALVQCERRFPGAGDARRHGVGRVRGDRISRESINPGTGYVTLAVEIRSDRSEVAQEGRDVLMIGRHPDRKSRG